jgi:hypothetical protein
LEELLGHRKCLLEIVIWRSHVVSRRRPKSRLRRCCATVEERLVDRYKLAMAQGKQSYEKAIEEDQALLGEFGMGLLSVQNGPRVVIKRLLRGDRINPWDVLQINAKLWGWLRPLLIELIQLRQEKARWEAGLNGGNGGVDVDAAGSSGRNGRRHGQVGRGGLSSPIRLPAAPG